MRRTARTWIVSLAIASAPWLVFVPEYGAIGAGGATHACREKEKSATCPSGQARLCFADGSSAGCGCPAGGVVSKGASSSLPRSIAPSACVFDASIAVPSACTVASIVPSAIAVRLDAELSIRELESPSLPAFAGPSADQTIADLDAKLATLSADDLVRLAVAHEQIEGASAYVASTSLGSKQGLKIVRRDASVDRAIEVRRSFLNRFDADRRRDDQRVLQARALLRRAVYRSGSPDADLDRAESRRLVDAVASTSSAAQPSATSSAARDACYMLAESEVRAHAWTHVSGLESEVLRLSTTSLRADDPPYAAAAHARLAQAALALQSPMTARGSLASAIDAGDSCVPRAECVSVGAAARAVLPETWALLGSPARTMVPLLSDAALTSVERRGPLLRLAELLATQSGPACADATEEARAWADALR